MKALSRRLRAMHIDRLWITSLLINGIILGIMLLLFCPKYSNFSDIIMQNLLYGTLPGLQTGRIFFSNALLGSVVLLLVKLIPGVAWYTIVQYLFLFFALTVLGYVVLQRSRGSIGVALAVCVLTFLGYQAYVTVGYLLTACILTATGAVLFIHALCWGEDISVRKLRLAAVLAVAGGLYSFKAFMLVMLINLAMGVAYLYLNGRRNIILRFLSGLGFVVLVSLLLFGVDCLFYLFNGGFRNALAYRGVFEKLYTYGTNGAYSNSLMDLGIANADHFKALIRGFFLNGTDVTLTRLKSITDQARWTSPQMIDTFFKTIPLGLFTKDIFYLWLGTATWFLAFARHRARILLPCLATILPALFIAYARYSLNLRVYGLIFVPVTMHMLLYTGEMKAMDWKPAVAFAMVFSVILYTRFSSGLYTSVRTDAMSTAFASLEKKSYLLDLDSYAMSFGAFTRYPTKLVPKRVYVVNGFYSTMTPYSPAPYTVTDASDSTWISNPYKYSARSLPDYALVVRTPGSGTKAQNSPSSTADRSIGLKGLGTEEAPYRISSAEDLALFAKLVNSGHSFKGVYFLQTKNIDLERYRNWDPIGVYGSGHYFEGTYDGGCHYIENLTIIGNRDETGCVGLFGVLNGNVINLGIRSGSISGHCAGSITSQGSGVIANCWNLASVTGNNRAGGICDVFSGYIVNCWNAGRISARNKAGQIVSHNCTLLYGCAAKSGELVSDEFTGLLVNCAITEDYGQFVMDRIENDKLELQGLNMMNKWKKW